MTSLEPWPKQERRGLLKHQAARQRVRHRTRNIRRRYSGQRCQRLSDAVPRLVRSFPTRTCHTTAQRLSQASPVLQRNLLNAVHPRRLCWNASLRQSSDHSLLTLNSRAMSHVDADGQAGRPRSVTARACSSSSLQRKRCRAVYAGIQLWAIVHTVCHFALCAGVCICIALQVRLTRSSGRCCGNLGSSCSDRGLLISTGIKGPAC